MNIFKNKKILSIAFLSLLVGLFWKKNIFAIDSEAVAKTKILQRINEEYQPIFEEYTTESTLQAAKILNEIENDIDNLKMSVDKKKRLKDLLTTQKKTIQAQRTMDGMRNQNVFKTERKNKESQKAPSIDQINGMILQLSEAVENVNEHIIKPATANNFEKYKKELNGKMKYLNNIFNQINSSQNNIINVAHQYDIRKSQPPGKQEVDDRLPLMAFLLGHMQNIAEKINKLYDNVLNNNLRYTFSSSEKKLTLASDEEKVAILDSIEESMNKLHKLNNDIKDKINSFAKYPKFTETLNYLSKLTDPKEESLLKSNARLKYAMTVGTLKNAFTKLTGNTAKFDIVIQGEEDLSKINLIKTNDDDTNIVTAEAKLKEVNKNLQDTFKYINDKIIIVPKPINDYEFIKNVGSYFLNINNSLKNFKNKLPKDFQYLKNNINKLISKIIKPLEIMLGRIDFSKKEMKQVTKKDTKKSIENLENEINNAFITKELNTSIKYLKDTLLHNLFNAVYKNFPWQKNEDYQFTIID